MVSKYWPVEGSINTDTFDHSTLSPQAIRHAIFPTRFSASEPAGDPEWIGSSASIGGLKTRSPHGL
jgi:hypothetical protein